jgi:hypothetical protein
MVAARALVGYWLAGGLALRTILSASHTCFRQSLPAY